MRRTCNASSISPHAPFLGPNVPSRGDNISNVHTNTRGCKDANLQDQLGPSNTNIHTKWNHQVTHKHMYQIEPYNDHVTHKHKAVSRTRGLLPPFFTLQVSMRLMRL